MMLCERLIPAIGAPPPFDPLALLRASFAQDGQGRQVGLRVGWQLAIGLWDSAGWRRLWLEGGQLTVAVSSLNWVTQASSAQELIGPGDIGLTQGRLRLAGVVNGTSIRSLPIDPVGRHLQI